MASVDQSLSQLSPKDLSEFIASNPSVLKSLNEEQLFNLFKRINPYCQVVDMPQKTVLFSVTNWKEEYIKKQKMVSLVKFLDRMVFEYDEIAEKLNVATDKVAEYKEAIRQFFDHVLKYDPKFCVRSSYQDKAKTDKSREPVTEEQKLQMPSLDVFERWQRFEESNSSDIRKEVTNFYSTRPDLEYAIQIYDVFTDDLQAEAFKDKHGPGLAVDIIKAQTNKWILLETTEKCIDKVKFYDKDNQILENMINQMKKDAEVGHKMMERRKEEMVKKNASIHGEVDKEKLKKYIDDMGPSTAMPIRESVTEQINTCQPQQQVVTDSQSRRTKEELFGISTGENGWLKENQYPVFVNDGKQLVLQQPETE